MKHLSLVLFALISVFPLAAQSRGVVFLRSLAVPGLSQVIDGRDYGYAMMTSEALIIGSMYFMTNESKVLKQDSYEYAIKFAHLNPGSYNSDFYNNLAKYESSGYDAGGYNAWVRKTAMEQFPYDPILQQEYIDTYSYGDDQYWAWDASTHRSEYNKLRNRSQDFKDYAMVATGVLILNHLVSGIDALRYNAQANRSHVSFGLKDKTPLLQLSYTW